MKKLNLILILVFAISFFGCSPKEELNRNKSAKEILGNPEYLAMSYGGFRGKTRDEVPTVAQIKEDMKILSAMGVGIIRTYNTKIKEIDNLLEAITQLKAEDETFEMYLMIGAWIDCQGAWTKELNHELESLEANKAEIDRAVAFAKKYPDIVKVIAVGNEAMVHWASSYFVSPSVILKWVNYLQDLKKKGELPADLWITSSDNYESWGGGDKSYQIPDLEALIKAVDFVSLHTYPFHETFYSPDSWIVPSEEEELSLEQKIEKSMLRAKGVAMKQYQSAADYIQSLGVDKPIHIGETGWASIASTHYGADASKAADEYKAKLFYEYMREWTNSKGMACFYFEAFDEQWKDGGNELGSENHFGLINLKGEAKFVLWEMVDKGVFSGLTRNGVAITKTYGGDKAALMKDVLVPPLLSDVGVQSTQATNPNRKVGEAVTQEIYVVLNPELVPDENNKMTYPSAKLKVNSWEGTCVLKMNLDGELEIKTGEGDWWGCALEFQAGGVGENMSNFKNGFLNFDIKGETGSSINIGFQTGVFLAGTQTNNFVTFEPQGKFSITEEWQTFKIPISQLNKKANLTDVIGMIYFRGLKNNDGKSFSVKKIYYSMK